MEPTVTSGRAAVAIEQAADILRGYRTVVLSGAGISTESGIPDYRGPETIHRKRSPIKYQEFVSSAAARQRYWARSTIGWSWFRAREPNAGHLTIARLQRAGLLSGVITQNVDRLHHKAGSSGVLELHGALAEAVCLECGRLEDRDVLQERMLRDNPNWLAHAAEHAPDGDAELPAAATTSFVAPRCVHCRGELKPNVVLFGESVPKPVVAAAWDMLAEAEALLVVGSSLMVYSGRRFVDGAAKQRKPVIILNKGGTRSDHLATVRIDGALGEVLPAVAGAAGLAER
jgi:NAD-dependent SIR2 family protein deacetylase